MKQKVQVLLALCLFVFSVNMPAAFAANDQIDYVALGDSIASGQTPYGERVGRGFTDIISEKLEKEGRLGSFTKEFAKSGETTDGLLEKLKREDVQKALKEAELVTIVSGANDFIQAFYDPKDESVNVDLTAATLILSKVSGNLTTAVKQVKAINPDAEIYLFGYFFPFPHMTDIATRQQLQMAFNIVNNRIAAIAETEGVHFVNVAPAFDVKGTVYLENPKDIHPNEAGYQVIADQFFLKTLPDLPIGWGRVLEKNIPVSPDKKWTITLSQDVDSASLDRSIFVMKDGSMAIPVDKSVSKVNGKQVEVFAPQGGYVSGSYELMITNELKGTDGKPLTESVLVKFVVK